MSFFSRIAKHSTHHPNKLVQKHDAFLISKSLKKKVKCVKSTLKNTNKYYSEKIKSNNLHSMLRDGFPFFSKYVIREEEKKEVDEPC